MPLPLTFTTAPNISDHFPPRSGQYVNYPYFSVNLIDDLEMNITSLNLWIDDGDGRGYKQIITAGAVQTDVKNNRPFQVRILPDPTRIYSHMMGESYVGRWKNKYGVLYVPRDKAPDNSKVNVSISCSDIHGNLTKDQYSFTVLGNKPYKNPYFSFYYTDRPAIEATSLYFGNAVIGKSYSGQFKIWWGKNIASSLDLSNCYVTVDCDNTVHGGKEILDNGWVKMKLSTKSDWVTMNRGTNLTLGTFTSNASKLIDFKLAIPSSATIAGTYALRMNFEPRRAPFLGYRPMGTTMVGGDGIQNIIKEQPVHRMDMVMTVIPSEYLAYLEKFNIHL